MKHFLKLFTLLLFFFAAQVVHAGLFTYQDKATGLYGFKDASGKVIIPPQFDHVYIPNPTDQELFSPKNKEFEFLVPVWKFGKMWRINQDGTIKFETVFFDNGPDYYEDGLSRFLKDGKVGFHDLKGNIVIKPIYDFASPFRDGHANVCNGCYAEYPKKQTPTYFPLSSSASLIERPFEGHHLLEPMYVEIIGGKWGVIDKTGKIITRLKERTSKR